MKPKPVTTACQRMKLSPVHKYPGKDKDGEAEADRREGPPEP